LSCDPSDFLRRGGDAVISVDATLFDAAAVA
jgi:hypothetical protein